ncbi:immunity 49 family protein [Myxococcaceae bacterium JPH2]|nr:immunity 49 family protein [Myxococcaceae bacterium JPH2]
MTRLAALRNDSGRAVQRVLRSFDPLANRESLIRDVEELCVHFHVIAVATLLVDGNPQGFFLNLCRAGENWRRLLKTLRARGLPMPASRHTAPLAGALTAGDWALAEQLAALSETRWIPDEEYRTEHAQAQLLCALVGPGTRDSALACAESLEALGGPGNEQRAACAKALLDADSEAFVTAFRAALLVHSEDVEKKAKLFTTPVTRFAPHRSIWMEGLALLRLAERAGIPTFDEAFLYCPPLARLPMAERYCGDWVLALDP